MQKTRIYIVFFLVLFASVILAQNHPKAHRGVLDLRGFVFEDETMLPLEGEWEFYWNQHLEAYNFESSNEGRLYMDYMTRWENLPINSNQKHGFGYATYYLKLICDSITPSLSLYLPETYTAFDIYVNREGFEGNGVVGKSKESMVPKWRPSAKIVDLKPGENELMLRMSNFHHHKGGPTAPIVLGTTSQINYWRNLKISSILFLAGCLLIAGSLGFGFYWFNRSDKSGIFFFLFCAAYMYRIMGTEEYVIHAANRNIPWELTLRLEYISLYLSVIFFLYFIKNLIRPRVHALFFHTVSVISGLMVLISIFLPTAFLTMLLDYYLIFFGMVLFYMGIRYALKLNFTHKTTYITTAGSIMMFVVVIHKTLEYFHIISENIWLSTFGYVSFICTMSVAMTIKFGRHFRESNMVARVAIETKEEFLNIMSHELRTPMNAIMGMTDMLKKSDLTDDQEDKLNDIQKNSESLMAIIMDILSITDAKSGKAIVEKSNFSIEDCVFEAYSLSKKERRETVNFVTDFASNIPTIVYGDALKIRQILSHLLSNAFKFTEAGEVRVRVNSTKINDEKRSFTFDVIDTGVGISEKTKKEMFSAFSQGDSRSTRRFTGVGIGLTIVRQLVDLMQGKLTVKSKESEGAIFSFTLELENAKGKVYNSMVVNTSLNVLYAEDNVVNQKLLQMMIASHGVSIDIAKNGVEAVKMAKKKAYDIILMDIQMPEMDGVEAARVILKEIKPKPVIIAVTANATLSDRKKCFEAGMNDFISKPVKANEIKEGLLKWQDFRNKAGGKEGQYIQLTS